MRPAYNSVLWKSTPQHFCAIVNCQMLLLETYVRPYAASILTTVVCSPAYVRRQLNIYKVSSPGSNTIWKKPEPQKRVKKHFCIHTSLVKWSWPWTFWKQHNSIWMLHENMHKANASRPSNTGVQWKLPGALADIFYKRVDTTNGQQKHKPLNISTHKNQHMVIIYGPILAYWIKVFCWYSGDDITELSQEPCKEDVELVTNTSTSFYNDFVIKVFQVEACFFSTEEMQVWVRHRYFVQQR